MSIDCVKKIVCWSNRWEKVEVKKEALVCMTKASFRNSKVPFIVKHD